MSGRSVTYEDLYELEYILDLIMRSEEAVQTAMEQENLKWSDTYKQD